MDCTPVAEYCCVCCAAAAAFGFCFFTNNGCSQIKLLVDNPDQWALLLGAAIPNTSNFFLNYVIARAFMMNLFRLIMPRKLCFVSV